MAVKIAPDLSPEQIGAVARIVVDLKIDGVIATNTTIARDAVAGVRHAEEAGGLSGAPLRARATEVIRQLNSALDGAAPIIGVGGIVHAVDALEKIAAGATLVQFYTGMIYRGPDLVRECVAALATAPGATRPAASAAPLNPSR